MRQRLRTRPRRARTVREEVARLCKELRLPVPGVGFWSRASGQYDSGTQTIWLPSIDWFETYEPDTGEEFWFLVYHEFSHYVDECHNGQVGHTPEMFAIALSLVQQNGMDVHAYLVYERNYKPRALKRGLRLAGKRALTALRAEVLDKIDKPLYGVTAAARPADGTLIERTEKEVYSA